MASPATGCGRSFRTTERPRQGAGQVLRPLDRLVSRNLAQQRRESTCLHRKTHTAPSSNPVLRGRRIGAEGRMVGGGQRGATLGNRGRRSNARYPHHPHQVAAGAMSLKSPTHRPRPRLRLVGEGGPASMSVSRSPYTAAAASGMRTPELTSTIRLSPVSVMPRVDPDEQHCATVPDMLPDRLPDLDL